MDRQASQLSSAGRKGGRKAVLASLGALLLCLPSLPAAAQVTTDRLIEGAKLCTRQLPRYEREYGIPTHLLSAIASTESGRYHKGLKIKVPWPWTINAEGTGYYFDSKAQAIAMVRKLRAQGIKSIDVGCMQVNLVHHPMAFSSLEEAFDPEHNVAYAASFLRSIYQEEHSWKKAAAYYHSRVPSRGSQYVGNVYRSWYNIVDKLRMAEIAVPASSITAMNGLKQANESELAAELTNDRPYGASRVHQARQDTAAPRVKAIQVARLPEQEGKKVAPYHSPRMNSIKVTTVEHPRRDRGVIIVTPDIKVVDHEGVRSASNIPVRQASASNPRVIQVAQAASPAVAVDHARSPVAPAVLQAAEQSPSAGGLADNPRKNGPTFIFND